MAETKQGLEVALYLIHKSALNHQSEALTLPNSDGDNANGVATQSSDALSPYPEAWYDVHVDRFVAGNTVPVFMQPMGDDVDAITGPNQFVFDTATKKVHVSDYSATDVYTITFRDENGGQWSLIQYKRSFDSQENQNVRPVHQWDGSTTHFKKGIFSATQSFSMVLSDPFDAQNMLLFGDRYNTVVEEPILTADFTLHDGAGDPDIWVADLELNAANIDWSRLVFSSGVVGTSVASIVAITSVGKYFIDIATEKLYVGVVNGGTPMNCEVTYRTSAVFGSQEFLMRADFINEDGNAVEFTVFYPKAQVADISVSNPDADDCMVTCNMVSCGFPTSA